MTDSKNVREARAEIMRERAKETSEFLELHPEFAYTLASLTGTVLSCPRSGMSLKTIELEKAFEHLQVCEHCKYNCELTTEQQLHDMSPLRD